MASTTLREMLVKQEPRNISYCYLCSGPRAEYPIFSKPYGDYPFFPFLEHHQPPEGAESMRTDGRVLTCLVCYTFLTQQWDSYEKSKTPQSKRIYWLKRLDGGPYAGMDVNLQQDYESLFETSNAATESDSRPKQKNSRSHYISGVETKQKLSERPENVYPGAFNFSSHSADKVEGTVSNILDLSLPARTPSRTSNSSSPAMNFEVCYMCGQETKNAVNIFIKPIANCPFFPSIISHPKPVNAKPLDSSGKVFACETCHRVLIQQWDYYQRKNVPQKERVYQSKIVQNIAVKNDDQASKSFVCFTCGSVTQVSVQRFIHAYPEKNGDPFFSFLLNLNPYPGANKLANGKAAVCSLCYKTLFRQLRVYEVSNTPEERRKYKILNETVAENFSVLRQHLKSGGQSHETILKYDCYICEYTADSLLIINTLPISEMHFPFIRGLPKPANACPMDSEGCVKICSQCHSSLVYQYETFEHARIPIQQRQYKINSKLRNNDNHFHENVSQLPITLNAPQSTSVASEDSSDFPVRKPELCGLCARPLSSENACYIHTVPQEKIMYFPSITFLLKPESKSIDQYGRILACNQCHLILKNQWEVFESAHVPHSQRQYEIFPPQMEQEQSGNFSSDGHLPSASAALHIQVSSPDLKVDLTKHQNIEPLLTTVNTLSVTTITSTNASASNSPQIMSSKSQSNIEEPIPRISGPLDVPITRPLLLAPIYCYVCTEFNVSGLTYTIKSLPTTPVGVDKPPEEVPFFPFLTKHVPPDGEKLRNDGSALVCMFCYYSLISQWLAYESSPYPEDSNRWHRRYNFHNYVCFICGITTYRKRVCTISVKDFPFLLEHSRPPGALTVLNGECVVTCQTCFESITSQWKDFERMKVPVEMRKYNWIVISPPADDENSRGCQILAQENSGSASNLSQADGDQAHADDAGIPSGLKPPPPHLTVPSAYGLTKPVGRNVISPVHQSSSHSNTAFSPFGNSVNPALNATRTSSFAAALRKLAKQAVDPVAEKDLSPVSPASSPASSQQSSHSRHHAPLPMYLNSHSSNPSGHRSSSPVVTVTSMQGSQGKALDLGRYSNSSRNGSLPEPVSLKVESSKLSSSGSDKRSDSGGTKHVSSSDQLSLRHEHNMPSRGFQPYRNSEEHHSTPPQMYNPSPPPTTMGGYTYHPSYAQSSQLPPQPYRLEESMYMERYGLLRPSAMPYSSSSNILSHPRAPLYPASHYPPELIPQSIRPTPSSSSAYPPSRFTREDENGHESNMLKKHEIDSYHREHEQRYMERKEEREYREREVEYLRKERHLRQSPVLHPHSTSRSDMAPDDKGHMGSITHGTPRDYVRRMSPPSSVSIPLNLATNVMNAENDLEEEMGAKMLKYRNKAILNGQIHYRSGSHMGGISYRKENDAGSYNISYQIKPESHQKATVTVANTESSVISGPTKVMPYYVERDFAKSEQVETRTLSMASVINSQINGIFAREKFVSNNSYDYLNSFTSNPEKSIFSESTQKLKTESKSALSASETYLPHLKSSNSKAPVQESSQFDATSNKLPSFLLSDRSFPVTSESNNYPPLLKSREPSITRALLQNPVVTSYETDTHAFEEPLPKFISVLDKREDKLRKLRKAGEMLESDYSDPDSDEEDAEHLKIVLKITKGPRPKLKLDPKQTIFLSNFGLTTHSKKQIIELKKCIRRHQVLREKSCSPLPPEPTKSAILEYDPKHLSELSRRLCLEEDFVAKTDFFKMLGLVYLTSDQKSEKEKVLKVVENERLRRNGVLGPSQRCLDLQGSSLGKRASTDHIFEDQPHSKKPNVTTNLSETIKPDDFATSDKPVFKKYPAPLKPVKPSSGSGPRISAFLKPPFRSANLPVPPLIPANQAVPPPVEPVRDVGLVAKKDPLVQQLKKFAQEFHNSVLQTTQMQLEKKNLPSSVHVDAPFQKPSSSLPPPLPTVEKSEPVHEESHSTMFRWPGIEAIMESYECHISEQAAERTFLLCNSQKLKALIQESNTEVECLGCKTEELMHEQKLLELERRELKSKIEALGLFIQHFR